MPDLVALPDRVVTPGRSRLRVGLGAAVVLVLVGLAVAVLVAALGGQGGSRVVPAAPGASSSASAGSASSGAARGAGAGGGAGSGAATGAGTQTGTAIFVHLLGAVARPGLYELREGARGVDAVAAAGGFAADADQAQLNLARPLTDGEQIVVPVIGAPPPVTGSAGPVAGAKGGKVDLNTADAAALDTLPGVGPSTAQRILDWRAENGRFTAVEDLLSVSGIGEKTFADLKDLVTV